MLRTSECDMFIEGDIVLEKTPPSDKTKRWLVITALILYAQAGSIHTFVRSGFLADAFSSRQVSGSVYGCMEGSIFIAYIITYLSGAGEGVMRRVNNHRYLLAGVLLVYDVISVATGLVFQIPDNTTVIVLSTLLRMVQGSVSYLMSMTVLDYINAHLSEVLDLCNGLVAMGHFTGHGLAECVGCVLYNNYGYLVPFLAATGYGVVVMVLVWLVVPDAHTLVGSEKEDKMASPTKLTPLLGVPMLATMLVSANYGVIQVTLTPFLYETFNKSLSYGGVTLSSIAVATAVGSVTVGVVLQKQLLHTYSVMGCGAVLVGAGLLITFPPESLPGVFNLAPLLAVPGVCVAGFGDPWMSTATLRAMYDMQHHRTGVLTPRTITLISGVWMTTTFGSCYSGAIIAGVLTDYLTFSEMAGILAGICFLSVLICVGLRVFVKDKIQVDNEKIPLIQ